jgi:hypothetical protein
VSGAVQSVVCEHTADSNSAESAGCVNMTADKEDGYEEFGTETFLEELCAPLHSCNTECSIAQVAYSSSSHSAIDDDDDVVDDDDDMIYLSTAIGFTPGGSGTVHTVNT